MAEGESVKLFVGQVPKQMSEVQLLQLLRDFALVDEVKLIRDKETRASRGCCFAICPSREEADKAVNACHEKITLPGASRLLQMKYADGELDRLEHKLFVGMLPKTVSDAEVSALFSVYGTIKDLQILRGSGQTSKGCALFKFETIEQALAAIEALNGKHKMEGSSIPLVVKWADTEKERQTRKVRKALLQASTLQIASGQHQAVYGALPMSYVPTYNGYGYQLQNRPTFPNLVPTTAQGRSICGAVPDPVPGTSPSNYAAPSANYIGSAYPTTPGVHYPWTHPRAIMNNQQFGASSTLSPFSSSSQAVAASRVRASSVVHVEGPLGANLFIFHIPQQYGDIQLANLFQRFGRVLSAKVFVDKTTNVSKCFGINSLKFFYLLQVIFNGFPSNEPLSVGFVSYDSPAAAQNAINAMNGYQLGGKKLKVQLKRES
ncbi:RNA-binding protein BRN1-like isoform X2 [Salvia splendens]|uniref:RNA-binding protein BRN1-like isoform X2 n=1 Tax=Salvia splendens TaxID=180675 RepID=UPI001C252F78|nr:RNA-binding protein BRN1-like isoform X2 [Salvia splendens]